MLCYVMLCCVVLCCVVLCCVVLCCVVLCCVVSFFKLELSFSLLISTAYLKLKQIFHFLDWFLVLSVL